MRRYAAKVDIAQPGIVRVLKAVGASVEVLPGGGGRPDLLVGYRGQNYLGEVKTPGREKHDKAHVARQQGWRDAWRGSAVYVWTTPDEALRTIGAKATHVSR